jgi:ubiquinone/menaquinone biosynthesis C-methylase UbiE
MNSKKRIRMKKYWSLGYHLPRFLTMPLFGDRELFGYVPSEDDKDWQAWQALRQSFYQDTQRHGPGKTINDSGYEIMQEIDLSGKHVMEIGPGSLPHIRYWKGRPQQYTLVDVQQNVLDRSSSILKAEKIGVVSYLTDSYQLPIPSNHVDILISFYSLEHLYPLELYLEELKRVLRPGGKLVGAIPTEGGLAWGIGRFLTSRRYIKKLASVNPDKIISWMHPNFADNVMMQLDNKFEIRYRKFWPFRVPSIDLNLIISFIGKKENSESIA